LVKESEEEMKEMSTTREITLASDVFEKLYEIMRKRGFPEKPVSESQVVAEAIELLHKKNKAAKEG